MRITDKKTKKTITGEVKDYAMLSLVVSDSTIPVEKRELVFETHYLKEYGDLMSIILDVIKDNDNGIYLGSNFELPVNKKIEDYEYKPVRLTSIFLPNIGYVTPIDSSGGKTLTDKLTPEGIFYEYKKLEKNIKQFLLFDINFLESTNKGTEIMLEEIRTLAKKLNIIPFDIQTIKYPL